MINKGFKFGIALCTLILSGAALAMQNGVLIKNERIYVKPASNSASAGNLPRGSTVTVIARQAGWLQVSNGRTRGWVRILSVRTVGAQAGNRSTDYAGVAQMATGKRQPGRIVATAGIRGLSEEDLKSAHFDEQQLEVLSSYQVSAGAAQSFARQGQLMRQSVAYLPNPSAAQ